MFALFFSLYYSMFRGQWIGTLNYGQINQIIQPSLNAFGKCLTSLFNNVSTPYETLGTDLFTSVIIDGVAYQQPLAFASIVLTFITSIGIVFLAVKGIKKAFGIFFMGIR